MDIVLHYELGYGWKGSFSAKQASYNGEYKHTPQEALEAAWKALSACREMGAVA